MEWQPSRAPSIPPEPGLMASVLRVLERIDELPAGATGALRFPELGIILLQSKRVCWAVATPMRLRLTDILRKQRSPPLARQTIEDVYRRCKESGTPLGEALVASGLVSEAGLRAALFKHNSEAIAHLGQARVTPDAFIAHERAGYDPKFSFSTAELLASLGAALEPARARAAQIELGDTLVAESSGAAFVRGTDTAGAMVIAVDPTCELPASGLTEACNWAAGLFDMARTFDPTTRLARAVWGERTALVTWRVDEVGYVALCSSRAAAARLMSTLAGGAHMPHSSQIRRRNPGDFGA